MQYIAKLDDNYHTNWSLFGKKTHTESTINAWVLIFCYFNKDLPNDLSELNEFITTYFTGVEGFSDSVKVDDRFAWG